MAPLPTILRLWRDAALTNHINESPIAPPLQGNQCGKCLLKQGGELFDAFMVSNQGRVDGRVQTIGSDRFGLALGSARLGSARLGESHIKPVPSHAISVNPTLI